MLLANNSNQTDIDDVAASSFGFYWTEGNRGIGWASGDTIPALKGGSGLGIPSAPAMILPSGGIATPHLCDAERLQGFPEFWTAPAAKAGNHRSRWRLVGNAVNVRVTEWLGRRLANPGRFTDENLKPLCTPPGPNAAYGRIEIATWRPLTKSLWRENFGHCMNSSDSNRLHLPTGPQWAYSDAF